MQRAHCCITSRYRRREHELPALLRSSPASDLERWACSPLANPIAHGSFIRRFHGGRFGPLVEGSDRVDNLADAWYASCLVYGRHRLERWHTSAQNLFQLLARITLRSFQAVMQGVFLSYARVDANRASQLAEDIRALGFNVWIDKELSGGQMWWDEILSQIRHCDILVFSVSDASCRSQACMRELSYAESLGKTVIPVLVDDGVAMGALPPNLGKRQLVEFLDEERGSALRLARSLRNAQVSRPLPSPLPEPPEVPLSYLGKIALVLNQESLSLQEQSLDLKEGLNDKSTHQDALQIMQRLARRRDLFALISKEVDRLLASQDSLETDKAIQTTPPGGNRSRLPEAEHRPIRRDVLSEPKRAAYSGVKLILIKLIRVSGFILLLLGILSIYSGFFTPEHSGCDVNMKTGEFDCSNRRIAGLGFGLGFFLLFWSMTMKLWFYNFLASPFRLVNRTAVRRNE